jgi:transcriptional regulator with XRE-family HTH domain
MSIGTKIRRLRVRNKMSQEELAFKLNVAQTSISNFEADKTVPDFVIMQQIGEVFEVGLEYFIDEKKTFTVNKNIGGIVGDNATINNSLPEGIIENMLKRIELLEEKFNTIQS